MGAQQAQRRVRSLCLHSQRSRGSYHKLHFHTFTLLSWMVAFHHFRGNNPSSPYSCLRSWNSYRLQWKRCLAALNRNPGCDPQANRGRKNSLLTGGNFEQDQAHMWEPPVDGGQGKGGGGEEEVGWGKAQKRRKTHAYSKHVNTAAPAG